MALRPTIEKWDLMKLKRAFAMNENMIQVKRQSTEWEKNPGQIFI